MLNIGLEAILARDAHVRSAVIFGRGRINAGILVDPAPADQFDPTDETKLHAYRELIWYVSVDMLHCLSSQLPHRPSINEMNEFAPQHSRIFKEVASYHGFTV